MPGLDPTLRDQRQNSHRADCRVECAPAGGQIDGRALTELPGFSKDGSPWFGIAHTALSSSVKLCRTILPARRSTVSPSGMIYRGIWSASGFRSLKRERLTTKPADTIEVYEARIAALERLVGRQALTLSF